MTGNIQYLIKPGKIGPVEVSNRMVMTPMCTSLASPDGHVTQNLIDHYEARAKGGVGLIVVENILVHPHEAYGAIIMCEPTMYDFNQVPGWKDLVDAVHFWGAKIFAQINYTGAGFNPYCTTTVKGLQPLTASAFTLATFGIPTKEATLEEIQTLIGCYGQAAAIAKMAGFDGICVHCTHGYGIASFQSPYLNHRTDEYGGSFENRMRFGTEIVQLVKAIVGNELAVTCRIPVDEWVPEGSHVDECVKIAQKYVEAGADAIDLSSGTHGHSYKTIQSRFLRHAFLEPYLEEFRKAIDVPIIVAGSFNDPLTAERVLKGGNADFIGLGRPLLADAEYPQKVIEGRIDDIRPCRRCMDGCMHTAAVAFTATDCAVNVEVGKSKAYAITKAEKQKKVLVIGGGPAGMEAARVAALRGHKVTLYEKSDKLGGNMIPGSIPSFKKDEKWLIDWFAGQLSKLGVRVVLNRKVTPDKLMGAWDAVIVATGAVPIIPDIPGVEKAVTGVDVLLGRVKVGKTPLIIGGNEVGCEVALFLAEEGKKCTILEMRENLAMDSCFIFVQPPLMEKLADCDVKWTTGMKVVKITNDGVVCVDTTGQEKSFAGDTVILAVGLKSVDSFVDKLKGKVAECYHVGDCIEPRKVYHAIHAASLIARRL